MCLRQDPDRRYPRDGAAPLAGRRITVIVLLAISSIGFVFRAGVLGVDPVVSMPFCNATLAASFLVIRVFFSPFLDGIPDRG